MRWPCSQFFELHIPSAAELAAVRGFMRNYINTQSFCWYAFIRPDFLLYYRYAQKWVVRSMSRLI